MSLTIKTIEEIEEFALELYEKLHNTHGPRHAFRTSRLAQSIARREGADVLICRLGALLHQYHPEKSGEVAKFLDTVDIDEEFKSRLVECVECVEPGTISDTCSLEAKVVFDADKLQTLGLFGLLREVVYRAETRQLDIMEAYLQSKKLQAEIRSKLQTKTGNEMAEELCQNMNDIYKSIEKWESLEFID